MPTSDKLFYRIGQVSEVLDIPISTLRWWMKNIEQLRKPGDPGRQRRFTVEELEIFREIKRLHFEKGLNLKGTQESLNNLRKHPPRNPLVCRDAATALQLLAYVKSRCGSDAHVVARIDAVTGWIKQTDSQT